MKVVDETNKMMEAVKWICFRRPYIAGKFKIKKK